MLAIVVLANEAVSNTTENKQGDKQLCAVIDNLSTEGRTMYSDLSPSLLLNAYCEYLVRISYHKVLKLFFFNTTCSPKISSYMYKALATLNRCNPALIAAATRPKKIFRSQKKILHHIIILLV